MNERLQQNLENARAALLAWQTYLANMRCGRIDGNVRVAEAEVCRAIDRAWYAQCMAKGSL